jgi:glycogen operon protein
MVPMLATRIGGSSDLYQPSGRRPYNSINYITCHDGFTLYDLVSYDRKHNEENGEDNQDGTDQNFSSNSGAEGPAESSLVILIAKTMRQAGSTGTWQKRMLGY